MKYIKLLVMILILILTCLYTMLQLNAADLSDINSSSDYADAVKRVSALGIMIGDKSGKFLPDSTITREQFAKIVIISTGLESNIQKYKGTQIFIDVSKDRWSNPYISLMSNRKLMGITTDDKFRPEAEMTFAEGCTVIIRAMGYKESELSGNWPMNYIEKAQQIGIIQSISLKSTDKLPRWAAAVMIDKLWLKKLKAGEIKNFDKIASKTPGLFEECIIFQDSSISEKLDEKQVLTDKGILYNLDDATNIDFGNKFSIIKDNNKIIKVYKKLKTTKSISVEKYENNKAYFLSEHGLEAFLLPENTVYYYNGTKANYNQLAETIKVGSSIVFSYNNDLLGYEYIAIYDPVYHTPEIVESGYTKEQKTIGSITLIQGLPIIKNGEVIDTSKINQNDIVYLVTDIWNNNRFIFIIDTKVEGKVDAVLPNKISPQSIQIENKEYGISPRMSDKVISEINFDDNVSVCLGYDGKIIKLFKLDYQSGEKKDLIILGDSKSNKRLISNQYLTDQGIFNAESNIPALDLGAKYSLVISNSKIVKLIKKLNITSGISVVRAIGATIEYKANISSEKMILPENINYYYNGNRTYYEQIKDKLNVCTSIIFGYTTEEKKDYAYAILIDPISSKPEIFKSYDAVNKKIGDISVNDNIQVIKGSQIISVYSLVGNDIVYKVSDLWGTYSYILAVQKTAKGKYADVLPNVLSPKSIIIDFSSYELSEDFDFNKLKNYKIGDFVTVYMGVDGKAINITGVN